MMKVLAKSRVIAVLVTGCIVSSMSMADDYYTEPQVYGMRPNPNGEMPLGQIGVTGLDARIYKGMKVTVESTAPNTPADGKFKKGDIILGINGTLLKGKNPLVIFGKALTKAEATKGVLTFDVKPVMTAEQIFTLRKVLDQVYCDEKVGDYILDIVFATRDPSQFKLDIAHQIEYGASPRATLYLNLAARANAMLNGRAYATPQDVKEIAHDVLRHRIILTYEAEAEEVTSDDIVTMLLSEIPVP